MAAFPQWLPWALLSAVFAALTAIFAKLGLHDIDSDLAMLLRTAIIVVVTAMFVAGTGKWTNPLQLPTPTLGWLALATGASWLCYFRALQRGPASQVAPVDKLSVVLGALFAVAFLHERLAWREWLGVAMIAGGVLLMAIKR